MAALNVLNLSSDFTGYKQRPMPGRMMPEMMRRLLGGKFPDTGFAWDFVAYFQLDDGVWEPYNGFGEILPAIGYRISVEPENL